MQKQKRETKFKDWSDRTHSVRVESLETRTLLSFTPFTIQPDLTPSHQASYTNSFGNASNSGQHSRTDSDSETSADGGRGNSSGDSIATMNRGQNQQSNNSSHDSDFTATVGTSLTATDSDDSENQTDDDGRSEFQFTDQSTGAHSTSDDSSDGDFDQSYNGFGAQDSDGSNSNPYQGHLSDGDGSSSNNTHNLYQPGQSNSPSYDDDGDFRGTPGDPSQSSHTPGTQGGYTDTGDGSPVTSPVGATAPPIDSKPQGVPVERSDSPPPEQPAVSPNFVVRATSGFVILNSAPASAGFSDQRITNQTLSSILNAGGAGAVAASSISEASQQTSDVAGRPVISTEKSAGTQESGMWHTVDQEWSDLENRAVVSFQAGGSAVKTAGQILKALNARDIAGLWFDATAAESPTLMSHTQFWNFAASAAGLALMAMAVSGKRSKRRPACSIYSIQGVIEDALVRE